MRSILFVVACITSAVVLQAQTVALYGTTSAGGTKGGGGTIFRIDTDGNNFKTEYEFPVDNPGYDVESLDFLSLNGHLYGVTYDGGTSDMGVLFDYNLSTNIYTALYQWTDIAGGQYPVTPPVTLSGNNNVLYGMLQSGQIYSYNLTTKGYTNLVSLEYNFHGGISRGANLLEFNGAFYLATPYGTTDNNGAILKIDPVAKTVTKMTGMPDNDARGRIIIGADGMIYGISQYGGDNEAGFLYQFNPTTNTAVKKIEFATSGITAPLGTNPNFSLVLGSNNKIYGSTARGGSKNGGTIFEFDPTTSSATARYDMGGADISGLNGVRFTRPSVANLLYLTAFNGGIFEFNTSTFVLTPRISTQTVLSAPPVNGLVFDLQSNLYYGGTVIGGTGGKGFIYSYAPGTTPTVAKKLDFSVAPLGAEPTNSLYYDDATKKLYGMTLSGGTLNSGILYEFDLNTKAFTKKVDLDNSITKGAKPYGAFVKTSDGLLWGTMSSGGANASGGIFSYNPVGNVYTLVRSFGLSPDGSSPRTGLTLLGTKLYGTTAFGGASNNGTIFEIDPVTKTYAKRFDFSLSIVTEGVNPQSPLFAASDGKLYGMTSRGGTTYLPTSSAPGTIFSFDVTTGAVLKKYDFSNQIQTYSYEASVGSGFIEPTPGTLLGLTSGAGKDNYGMIFEYTTSNALVVNKFNMVTDKGAYPRSTPIAGDAGRFYFLASSGTTDLGNVVCYDPAVGGANGTFSVHRFTGTNGGRPTYGPLVKSTLVFDITAPIVLTDNTPTSVAPGGTLIVTVTLEEKRSAISGVQIMYKNPSSSASPVTSTMNRVGTTDQYTFTIPASAIGDLGVQYKILATSGGGSTDPATVVFKGVPLTKDNTDITYTAGTTETSYRIISIPSTLTDKKVSSVFDELGAINKKMWRLSRYQSAFNVDLQPVHLLEPGLGYWLLAKEQKSIKTGPGTTVKTSTDDPFVIALSPGWNQIGNPYPFTVTWADIVAANPGVTTLPTALKGYNGGFADVTSMAVGTGAFLNLGGSQNLNLKIPSVKTASRVDLNKNQYRNSLTDKNWKLYIDLKQGDLINGISGIGMNEQALDGIDRLDDINMPRFFERFLEINHTKKPVDKESFLAIDVVPTAPEHVWEFDVASDESEQFVTLSWENDFFGDNEKTLVLWDEARQIGTDMRTHKEYTFDRNISASFKVYYGDKSVLNEKVKVTKLLLHSLSPNPANGPLVVAFSVPETREVTVQSLDLTGRVAWRVTRVFEKGYHELVWNDESRERSKGMYVVQLKGGGEGASSRVYLK